MFVPKDNVKEASAVGGMFVYGVNTLHEVVDVLNGNGDILPYACEEETSEDSFHDFSQVQGQHMAKRALEIAAAASSAESELIYSNSAAFTSGLCSGFL